MAFADRVQDTTTTTGTGALTLSNSAPAGFRSFSAAHAIGDTFDYFVGNGSEWEVGVGTLIDATTVSRAPTASSNGGALVNFSAGAKTIFSTVSASSVIDGLANPRDPGFDIVLCCGQSNMIGLGAVDAAIDVADPRVFQWGTYPSDTATYQKITKGVEPLQHPYENPARVSPASWFSRTYAGMIPSNRKVLLVPVAKGGIRLVGGYEWTPGNPGGEFYENAISQANAAVAFAKLMYPNSRYVGALWLQGESDGDWTQSTANYATVLKTLIAGFRSRITGAANSWFIIGGMVPEAVSNRNGYAAIQAAHVQVANETAKCAFAPGISGNQTGDNLHYNAQGNRLLGCGMAIKVPDARIYSGVDNTLPTIGSATVSNATPTSVTLAASELLGTGFVPAAAAFSVSGHTVSAVAVSGNSIVLTVSPAFVNGEAARTVAYTQPGSNGARDLAGNLLASFSGLAVTNNVQPADITAPSFASAQVANASPTVIQITMSETLANVVPAASAFAVSGGKTVSSVSIAGAVISLTCSAAYANGDTITVTYTKPGTNPIQDAAGNQTSGFGPSSVTNNVAVSGGSGAMRYAQLANMSESGTGPYTYTGGGSTYNTSAQGGTSTTSLAGDGSVTIQIGNGQGKPMLALKTATTTVAYSALPYLLFANTGGYEKMGNSGTAGTTGITSATGDLMRLTRTGTTIVAAVSKDSGSSWTTIYTWAGVAAGTMYAQILVELSGTITNPTGTGWA